MKLRILIVLLVICSPLWVAAGTVYKTVDADGRVSYSDIKPSSPELEVREIDLPDKAPSVDLAVEEARLKRISETADKLRQARLEQKEVDIREQEVKQSIVPPQQVIVEEKHVYYPNAFQRHHHRFPSRQHHRTEKQDRETRPLLRSDDERDAGPVIVPKSRLLTP